jgi:hypothetical protein
MTSRIVTSGNKVFLILILSRPLWLLLVRVQGTIAEGFGDGLCAQLSQLLEVVLASLSDEVGAVRSAGLFALAEFSRQLQPEISAFSSEIIPRIFQLVNSETSPHVRYRSLYAYQSFAESLAPEEIAPHIDGVVMLCTSALRSSDEAIKELVFPVLSATVLAAEEKFLQYMPVVGELVTIVLQDANPDTIIIRARAIEFIGVVAITLKEAFIEQAQGAFPIAMQLATNELPEVREYTYGYFNHMAQILENNFNQYLPVCVASSQRFALDRSRVHAAAHGHCRRCYSHHCRLWHSL